MEVIYPRLNSCSAGSWELNPGSGGPESVLFVVTALQ